LPQSSTKGTKKFTVSQKGRCEASPRFCRIRFCTRLCLLALFCLLFPVPCFLSPALADRIVLAPDGNLLSPDSVKVEYFINPNRRNSSYAFGQYASPDGIELEFNRVDLAGDLKNRYGLNIQYPFLSDLGATPAIALGIRDISGTGLERQAFYVAAGKSVPLSDRQARLLKELRWSAGIGTGYMDTPWVGVQLRLRSGLKLAAEWWRNRPNVSLSLPLNKDWNARAYSLDGDVFYGLTYTLLK
jgi:hypothetical protein